MEPPFKPDDQIDPKAKLEFDVSYFPKTRENEEELKEIRAD